MAAAAAALVFLFLLFAYLAHADRPAPFPDFFTALSLTVWNLIGVVAFLLLLGVIAWFYFFPGEILHVIEASPEKTGTHLHVRCGKCNLVDLVQDTGARPLEHFCPRCGQAGTYGDPEHPEHGFIYTQMEIKLGCRNCNTTFTIPEPLQRPLFARCPNCRAYGVLSERARVVQAIEIPITCVHCGHGFDVYAAEGGEPDVVPCPRCGAADARGGAAPSEIPAPDAVPEMPAEAAPEAAAGAVALGPVPAGSQVDRPVIDIEGIGPAYATRLAEIGVKSIGELRGADAEGVAQGLGISATVVRQWQSMGELMEVPGIGPQFAELLVRSGVESVAQLRGHKPKALLEAINQANEGRKVRIQGRGVGPKTVESWIRAARRTNA